ncbi:MAG: phosphoadenylyl-sulfate reductase [Alphaproteobacteria bacterium]|nr:phosphoadenylyl-sulfate reductase [Alphaproteobacteria bacterium]
MPAGADLLNDPALTADLSVMSLIERLGFLAAGRNNAVFTTSLGLEDQVLTAALTIAAPAVRIVTLETGRLFPETLSLIDETEKRYGIAIERFRPDPDRLAAYVEHNGLNGFYESVEARRSCCNIRKLEPLARALSGADLWITGLRRAQSGARSGVAFTEHDRERALIKANPLADWTAADVSTFVEANAVPINPLHERGFPSIGCEPCTRAIRPGEDERAGRWWWENDDKRECGLHVAEPAATPVVAAE